MDDRTKLSIWKKATKVRGKDPELWRKDMKGHEVFWRSYDLDTEMGWICKNISRKTVNFNLDDFEVVAKQFQNGKVEKKDEKKNEKKEEKKGSKKDNKKDSKKEKK
jgi:hypothetical protein